MRTTVVLFGVTAGAIRSAHVGWGFAMVLVVTTI